MDVAAGALFQVLNFLNELADVFELAVDGDVTNVGDRIDAVEFFHDLCADVAGGNFAEVVLVEFRDDFIDGVVDAAHVYGAFLASFDEALADFIAVEGLALAAALDDLELCALDGFVGGVSVEAVGALTAAADGCAVLGRARVDDLIEREKAQALSGEERRELEQYLQLEHVVRLAKAKARQRLSE